MPLTIVPYTEERVAAVQAFNGRIAQTGFEFPETPDPGWFPDMALYVAVEDEAVRGGYILRCHEWLVSRETTSAAHFRLPLSEGVIDRKYGAVGTLLMRDALARQRRLYAMGMGGWDRPLPRMLQAMKWRMCEVPFHFKVVKAGPFLRNIQVLRTSALRRFAMDVAASTGIGRLAVRRLSKTPCEMLSSFAGWGDEVWACSRDAYGLMAVRDAANIDCWYRDPKFLRVRSGNGWAVALDTQMQGHKQFGDMRVGTIVDCLAPPAGAANVIRAAAAMLEERGVDLIISNQLHDAWSQALLGAGFRKGPSNYLLALSPEFAKLAANVRDSEIHFNRGDGDGPIHL